MLSGVAPHIFPFIVLDFSFEGNLQSAEVQAVDFLRLIAMHTTFGTQLVLKDSSWLTY